MSPRLEKGPFMARFLNELVHIASLALWWPVSFPWRSLTIGQCSKRTGGIAKLIFLCPSIHIWLAASPLRGWHQVPDTLSRANATNQYIPFSSHSKKLPQRHGSIRPRTSLPRLPWLPDPIVTAPLTPRGTPAERAPPPQPAASGGGGPPD